MIQNANGDNGDNGADGNSVSAKRDVSVDAIPITPFHARFPKNDSISAVYAVFATVNRKER